LESTRIKLVRRNARNALEVSSRTKLGLRNVPNVLRVPSPTLALDTASNAAKGHSRTRPDKPSAASVLQELLLMKKDLPPASRVPEVPSLLSEDLLSANPAPLDLTPLRDLPSALIVLLDTSTLKMVPPHVPLVLLAVLQ